MSALSRFILQALAVPSYHHGAAHNAISDELVRLSLPHHPSTDRPELRV